MFSPSVWKEERGPRLFSPDVKITSYASMSARQIYEANFTIIKNDIHNQQLDWFHWNVGDLGTGKTWLSIRDSTEIDPKFLNQSKDLPQCPFNQGEVSYLQELCRKDNYYQRRGVAMLWDEGQQMLSARRSRSKESADLVDILTSIRQEYGFFIVANYQSVRLADVYVRTDRAKSLSRTMFTFDRRTMGHTVGNAYYYNKELLKQIKPDVNTRQIIWPDRPSFDYGFTPGEERFLKIYKLLSEKKYAAYTSKEAVKKVKTQTEARYVEAKAKLEEARLNKDVEKQDFWTKELKSLKL